jgi:ribosomal protein L3 glutamine methyltransferase
MQKLDCAMLADAATARELIIRGADLLESAGLAYAHGTDNPQDEAAVLVLHALGMDYTVTDSALDEPLNAGQINRVKKLLEQRVLTRKPAAYLTREAWFAGMPFFVDERVLIPRSPIAELIENRFEPWIDAPRVRTILDLCTGSGCIGIACAHYFPDAKVTVTDISVAALEVAAINIDRHGLSQQVTPLLSDVYSALDGQRFDIIVSNPPYVPSDEVVDLPEEFRHEPELGLVAGGDGLDVVVSILRDAPMHLVEGGILVVEVGHSQDLLVDCFPEVPFLWLDFEFGGEGVFILDRDQLLACQSLFTAVADRRSLQDPGIVE